MPGAYPSTGPAALDSSRMRRPVFVAGSPRSGTTLMQNCLARDPAAYHLGRESRFLWHRLGGQEVTGTFPGREAAAREYLAEAFRGDRPWTREELRWWARRSASQGTPVDYLDLPHDLLAELGGDESDGHGPFAATEQAETAPFTHPPLGAQFARDSDGPVRVIDKDTGHCWRLPELAGAFPDASFVLMVRDPEASIRSLAAGWRHPSWFFTYRVEAELGIPGYSDDFAWGRHWWNFNLFPGWHRVVREPLPRVCAEQWAAAMRPMAAHGAELADSGRAMFVSFEGLVADPTRVLREVAEFVGLDPAEVADPGLDRVFMSMARDARDPGSDDMSIATVADGVRDAIAPVAGRLVGGTP